jgi:flavorubredoxin
MIRPYRACHDIDVLPFHEPAGEFGYLPMNAFLIRSSEPILIETGMAGTGGDLLGAVWSMIEPEDLRWILLSHDDRDHSGNLAALLEHAPNARVVLNFLAMLKIGPDAPLTPDRVFFVNPGQSFTAGDREFRVVRPPLFDSAASIGFFDVKTRTLFSADSFGALIPRPGEGTNDFMEGFDDGFVAFNHANHPWIGMVDPGKFARAIDDGVRSLEPEAILAGHAPACVGHTEYMIKRLAALPSVPGIEMPDDAAFRAMLGRLKEGPPAQPAAGDAERAA